jgi:hypothetical protein
MAGWDQNGHSEDWLGECGVVHLAQDRDHRRVVVNAVMNLRVLAPHCWLVGYKFSTDRAQKIGQNKKVPLQKQISQSVY